MNEYAVGIITVVKKYISFEHSHFSGSRDFFDHEDKLVERHVYEHGKMNKCIWYYDDGKLRATCEYMNGKKNGLFEF